MNIDIVRIHFKDKELGEQSAYKYLPYEYCCDKLKGFSRIFLCNELDSMDTNNGIDEDGNLIPGFSLCVDEEEPWEEGTWAYYYRIDYCPFCGEKININVVNDVDKSELYTKLENCYKAFKEAAEETDSVKTKNRLEEEIEQVRRKMTDMWEFGEYDENG